MDKTAKKPTKLHPSYLICETIRWKVVKMAHNVKDDMEVAKMLLDCYDAIISGYLQWTNNTPKKRLPNSTSDKGWKLLEEIAHMMEWKDRHVEHILTAWTEDDDEEEEEAEAEDKTKEQDADDTSTSMEKDTQHGKQQIKMENETDDGKQQTKQKQNTSAKNKKKVREGLMEFQNNDKNVLIVDPTALATFNAANADEPVKDQLTGDSGNEEIKPKIKLTPEEEEKLKNRRERNRLNKIKSRKKIKESAALGKKPKQKRRQSMVQRLPNETTKYAPTGYRKFGRSTKAVEILYTPTQTKVIECKRCKERFTEADAFLEHFRVHTKTVIVGKDVRSVSEMKLGDIPAVATVFIPCNICNELTDNLELHNGNKHFERPCEICGDIFKSFGGWSRHMKVHRAKETGIKPHVCDICGRSYALIGAMTSHRKLHSTQRSCICEVCGKGFKNKSRLKRHMNIHTAESCACEFCGKTFNYKFNLKTHLRIHTGERPFKCTTCGKSYSHNQSLKAHAKSEHGIEMEHGRQLLAEFDDISQKHQGPDNSVVFEMVPQ